MSDAYPGASQQPPPPSTPYAAQPGAEYLDAGGGSPLPPDAPAAAGGGGRGRRGLLIGGGVAALALVGVGAWAATQFFATGAQPSEALPALTVGYASIDLDPSGTQKIEALRTLNKFPAFKDKLDLDTDDDILRAIFEEIDLPEGCQLSYDKDIEPWLGNRMAVAAVDLGEKEPAVVVVLQVKDADAADKGLTKIRGCAEGDDDELALGWVIDGDWAVVAQEEADAQAVVDAKSDGTLADDPEFQELTAAAGSAGIATMYAAPEAGKYFGDTIGGMSGFAGDLEQGLTDTDVTDGLAESSGENPLKNFKGFAATLRFDDGALELEGAGDAGIDLSKIYGTGRGGDVVETLPPATAAAIGVGFDEGWLTQVVEQVAAYSGSGTTVADLFKEASDETGLDVPADVEALFGESSALAFGSDFDPEAFFNSGDVNQIPVALKAKGDDKKAIAALEKVLAQSPPEASQWLGLDSDAGYFVIGPYTEYRTAILGNGGLGSTDLYKDVIRESDKASAVVFVNFNAGDDWLVRLVGDDPETAENVKPLAGFGIDVWQDDDWTHGVLRLTTD